MSPRLLLSVLLLAAAAPARAETPLDKELAALETKYETSVTAALEPLDRTYKAELEKLLKQETQAAHLDEALACKAALEATQPGFSVLRQRLAGTIWDYTYNNRKYKFSLSRDGTLNCIDLPWTGCTWRVTGPLQLTFHWPPRANSPMTVNFAADLQSFTNRDWSGRPSGGTRSYSATHY